MRHHKVYLLLFGLLYIHACPSSLAFAQTQGDTSPAAAPKELALVQSVMCEGLAESTPKDPAIVFSISIGEVTCFTFFDPVPEKTYIFHKWFHRDNPSTKRKLFLKSPWWATFSSIRLREGDKGPWRVEITDKDDVVLKVLRFSITE